MSHDIPPTIAVGDYVRVPKGITTYQNGWTFSRKEIQKVTTRETVVKITEVSDRTLYQDLSMGELSWITLLDYTLGNEGRRLAMDPAKNAARLAELKATVQDIIDAEGWVQWSTNRARLQDVIRLSDEEQKGKLEEELTPKAKKTTLRQLMIPKSKWKLTKDVAFEITRIWGNPKTESKRLLTLKAGAEFVVLDKTYDSMQNGIFAPIAVRETGVEDFDPEAAKDVFRGTPKLKDGIYYFGMSVKALDGAVEQVGEAAVQYMYVIRDAATGRYYKTTNYHYTAFHTFPEFTAWSTRRDEENPRPTYLSTHTRAECDEISKNYRTAWDAWMEANPAPKQGEYRVVKGQEPYEMFTKLSDAKKHTDVGKVKMSILNFTGYFDGMGDQQAGLQEWQRGASSETYSYRYPFPETFECVKFNKLTKEEIEVIDLQDWYKKTWRLRSLTMKFGSSVRGVYKKLEKADKLAAFSYVVTIRPKYDAYYEEAPTPEQIKAVDDFVKETVDKPVREKDNFGVSVAAASLSAAMMVRLAYDGEGEVAVIDFNEMEEVLEPAAEQAAG